jgi:hypothetical protein
MTKQGPTEEPPPKKSLVEEVYERTPELQRIKFYDPRRDNIIGGVVWLLLVAAGCAILILFGVVFAKPIRVIVETIFDPTFEQAIMMGAITVIVIAYKWLDRWANR